MVQDEEANYFLFYSSGYNSSTDICDKAVNTGSFDDLGSEWENWEDWGYN